MLYSFDHQLRKDATLPIPAAELTDEQLMAKIQEGDESALSQLHRRHRPLLRTIIGRMSRMTMMWTTFEQECLLEVWRHAARYDVEKGHALGWLVTLVRRRTIDRIRRKTAYGRAQDRFRDETMTVSESSHCGADEAAAQTDTSEAIARLIANLPVAQQEAVQLAFYKGMSQRQIAAHTGIPLGTIKTRLELALRKLRSSVLAFGELHEKVEPAHGLN